MRQGAALARLTAVAVTATALLGACQERAPGPPRPDAVVPASGSQGEAVAVTIRGAFYLDARLDFAGGESHVGTTFTATLGGVPLAGVRYVDATSLTATVPGTLPEGTHDLVVIDPAGRSGGMDAAFTVGAPPLRLAIEDAPGGAGVEIGAVSRRVGQTLPLFAVTRDPTGAFAGDADVTWSVVGGAGTIDVVTGPSTVFTAAGVGGAVVRADHAVHGFDETGVIDVTSCGAPADCADPCHGGATCVGGACELGPADRDVDGDGAVDATCPGGTDCDDDPTGCGAACRPGASEICDGRDNDCDPASGDGAGEPGFGGPCDGPDGDACAEGTTMCDGVSLSCDDATGTTVEGPPGDASCANGADDDCDGDADGSDADCAGGPVGTPPLVVMSVTPPAGDTATLFQGDATGTSDREGGALTYAWDWSGDGTFEAAGITSSHTFAAAGTYGVVLRVTDATGLSEWRAFSVVVSAASSVGTVTVAADEDDGTAAPGPDFSLREAILWANATGGAQTIIVPGGTVVALGGALPALSDAAGAIIVGDGAVLDGAALPGMTAICLQVSSSNNYVLGLEIRNCPNPLDITSGSFNQVERCWIHDNGDGVFVGGSSNTFGPGNLVASNGDTGVYLWSNGTVRDNTLTGHGANAIWCNGSADAATIAGNTVHDNYTGVYAGMGVVVLTIVHNTIAFNAHDGIALDSSSMVDCRNNILANNASNGIWTSGTFAALDYNAVFANAASDCSGCTHGPATIPGDPMFVSASTRDLRLDPGSPLIDAGAALAMDRNGAAPGDYDGAGPDIGAWESPY